MNFIDTIKERAKQVKKTIVLPESMDARVMEAAHKVLEEGIADIIIIGTDEEIAKSSQGFDISRATIINPYTSDMTEGLINELVELRKNKGMTYEEAIKRIQRTEKNNLKHIAIIIDTKNVNVVTISVGSIICVGFEAPNPTRTAITVVGII